MVGELSTFTVLTPGWSNLLSPPRSRTPRRQRAGAPTRRPRRESRGSRRRRCARSPQPPAPPRRSRPPSLGPKPRGRDGNHLPRGEIDPLPSRSSRPDTVRIGELPRAEDSRRPHAPPCQPPSSGSGPGGPPSARSPKVIDSPSPPRFLPARGRCSARPRGPRPVCAGSYRRGRMSDACGIRNEPVVRSESSAARPQHARAPRRPPCPHSPCGNSTHPSAQRPRLRRCREQCGGGP